EGKTEANRSAAPVGAGQVERRAAEEPEERRQDVPDAPGMAKDRPHVSAIWSAGRGAAVRAPRRASGSGALVVDPHAPAARRQRRLLLPLATGLDELDECPPREAVE